MILGSWQLAIVVVDLAQRYKYANANGRDLLQAASVFRVRGGRLVCADQSLDPELFAHAAESARKNVTGWIDSPVVVFWGIDK